MDEYKTMDANKRRCQFNNQYKPVANIDWESWAIGFQDVVFVLWAINTKYQ